MKTRITNLRAQLKYEYSPFVFTESSQVTLQKDTNGRVTSRGGEIIRFRTLSNDEFVKAYILNLSKWIYLTNPARKMLQYILNLVPERNNTVTIEIEKALAYTGYSSDVSIYDGLNDLVNHSIIARSMTPFVFYVNTRYILADNVIQFSERIERSSQAIAEREKIMAGMKTGENSQGEYSAVVEQNEQKKDLYETMLLNEKK